MLIGNWQSKVDGLAISSEEAQPFFCFPYLKEQQILTQVSGIS